MYALWPLIVLLVSLFLLGIVIFILSFKKGTHKKAPKPVVQPVAQRPMFLDKGGIKRKYIGLLNELLGKVNTSLVDNKSAYQELSVYTRDFIKEVSGLDVTTSTLADIKKMNIPVIARIIDEYYEPEFAVETDDDARTAILNAKRIIEQWN